MPRFRFRDGEYLVDCDVCGRTIYSSHSYRTWDGKIVCRQDYEERHPADFQIRVYDSGSVATHRHEPADKHSDPYYWDSDYCDSYIGGNAVIVVYTNSVNLGD